MRYNSIVSGSSKLLSVVLIFVLVHSPSDYLIALALQSGSFVVAGVAGLWSALSGFDIAFCRITARDIKIALADGWHLFVSNAATTLYTNTYVVLVGLFAGYTQAGYFSAAEKITRGITGTLGPLTQAVYPHIAVLASRSRTLAVDFLRKALVWVGGTFLLISFALFLFARPIGGLLFAASADGSLATLRWIAFLPFVLAVSTILAIQTMIPFGLEKQLGRIYIFAGLFSLVCSIPAIREFGSPGGGAALMSVELLVIILMWITLRQHDIHLLHLPENLTPAASAPVE
jgi:PST family polysaccharide transporter